MSWRSKCGRKKVAFELHMAALRRTFKWCLALPSEYGRRHELRGCPYRKSNPYVLMVQPSKNGPPLDAPGALNEPSNRRILA